MAGQNAERREVLRALSIAAGVASFPGFVHWAFAAPQTHAHPKQPIKSSAVYEPRFFTAAEYGMLSTLSELIIPTDDSPGAREAGVSEFLDFIVLSDPDLQYPFRSGLKWINAHSHHLYRKDFPALSQLERTEMLKHLALKDQYRVGEEDGRAFFTLLREYVVIGFYTSQIGMQEIGYPGLEQYRREVPGCPHAADDPQHKRLPPPIN
ncbi:MAG: gluconate 2-dehydrogenase subunit 3 family protein [Pyrinomonadaceae bacterium]